LEIEVMGKIVDLKPHQKTSVVEKWILDKK
jgi:hypothetical protein